MQHARNLLADPSVPVGRVAASVGYHQPAQFAKSFRRHHGTPPTNFRRALAADDKVTLLTPRDDRSVAPAYATAG
jgi:transcriptional regulator GlxA family with amidase domain